MKFETKAIWVGQAADEATGATIVPIYQTSTFRQEEVNKNKGYEYSRVANPTRAALDKCLASLEEGQFGLSFARCRACYLHSSEAGRSCNCP